MKIVHLSYRAYPNQVDPVKWIDDFGYFTIIWEALAAKHEVVFYECIRYEGIIERRGIRYIFRKASGMALLLAFQQNREIAKELPDVVIVHGLMFPVQVLMLRMQLRNKAKIIVQHHAEQAPVNRLKRAIQRLAGQYIDAYFFNGKALAEQWIAAGLIHDTTRLKEIMEVSSPFKQQDQADTRKKVSILAGNVYVWVGHLNANKNPVLTVRAFLRFLKDEPADAALYMIFQSNGLLEEIQAILNQNPKEARHIYLVGKVPHPELETWFSAADFIISSSYYEGSGIAVCEGMSCACIPILSDIPSFRFMTGSRCGLLYESGNEDALLYALLESRKLDKVAARQQTLKQFRQHLSCIAIARNIEETLYGL